MKIGTKNITKKYLGTREVLKEVVNGSVVYEKSAPGPVVDPILANNSWEVIKAVCQAGTAANYWSLGDSKNISVNIGGTPTDIPHAIVDFMENRYEYANDNTKHTNVVFQAVPSLGSYDFQFNPSTNTSPNGDTAYNGWDYSSLRASMNSGEVYGMYDTGFVALLEQVKTMAAYSGMTDTLVYSADKLFVPAAGEVKVGYTNIQPCEANITQYGYYALNSDANANRIKYLYNDPTSAVYWWLRSPYVNRANRVLGVSDVGNVYYYSAGTRYGLAPCFAW